MEELFEAIIETARERRVFQIGDVLLSLKVKYSRQYVSLAIARLVERGDLAKAGSRRYTYYSLPKHVNYLSHRVHKRLKNEELEEHEVLFQVEKELKMWSDVHDNLKSIFEYAFSEMLNNAIDHSQSSNVEVEVLKDGERLKFIVRDFGIGVFRNVMQKKQLASELEAIQDLLKGKVTTQPQAHTGEGIFFTSKIADSFSLDSYNYSLTIDNVADDIFLGEARQSVKGTRVTFTISLETKKHLNHLFKSFMTDPEDTEFDKTEIKIRLFTMGTVHVSRSQARRVLSGLEKFKTVTLDFDRVPTVGQAFVDEIFRVYKIKHPGIDIVAINTNSAVEFMINRVERP